MYLLTSSKRNWWLFLAFLLSGGGIAVVFFFTWEENPGQVFRLLEPFYLFLALLTVGSLWLIEGLRTKVVARLVGEQIRLLPAVKIYLASSFMANITPLTAGGPPAQAYFLYRYGIPLEKGLVVVAVRVLLTTGFFLVAVPFTLAVYWPLFSFSAALSYLLGGVLVFMISMLALFFYLIWRPVRMHFLTRWLFSLPPFSRFVTNPQKLGRTVYKEVKRFNESLQILLRGDKYQLSVVLFYTFLFWFLFFSLGPLLLVGLGLSAPFSAVVARQIVLFFLISYVPLPGGSGVAELGLASLFAPVVPKYLLGSFVGGWRFLTYHSSILAGAPFFLRLAHTPPLAEEKRKTPLSK